MVRAQLPTFDAALYSPPPHPTGGIFRQGRQNLPHDRCAHRPRQPGDDRNGSGIVLRSGQALHGTNPFWSSCPHRMACIGCDFSLPKNSARAVALESRTSIRRYLEEVTLTPDEQAIAAGDIEKLDAFVSKIPDTPATD